MSKEESMILKGVAILLMLFLHLFGKPNVAEICHPLMYLNGIPLVHILSRAANPVAFFIILSGYGLSYVYAERRLTLSSQGHRLLKLYIHYWLILLIFVSIGSFVRSEKYPGSTWDIFSNFISIRNSYNYETWFLLPYSLVSLTAYILFKIIDKLGNSVSVIFFFFITIFSNYVTSRYIAPNKLYETPLAIALTYLGFLFCFTVGAVMFRVTYTRSIRNKFLKSHPLVTSGLLVALIAFRCIFTTGAFHSIYVFLFIYLFLHIPLKQPFKSFFVQMGKHSMVMWMTHSFFCYYLFHDFIYGSQYPIIIYIVLLTISYIISIPIIKIAGAIIQRLKI